MSDERTNRRELLQSVGAASAGLIGLSGVAFARKGSESVETDSECYGDTCWEEVTCFCQGGGECAGGYKWVKEECCYDFATDEKCCSTVIDDGCVTGSQEDVDCDTCMDDTCTSDDPDLPC